jgi:TonB family C-terminal domain
MEILLYLLKANLAIIVFYLFYRICCRGNTFFTLHRYVLLAICIGSIIYPFLDISHWFKLNPVLKEVGETYIQHLSELTIISYSTETGIKSFPFELFLLGLYAGIAGFFLIRMLFRIAAVIRFRICCTPIEINSQKVYFIKDQSNPFSFFKWIFINPDSCTPVETSEILIHELVHVKQNHSIDILLSEFICVLCWFNPFAGMLKNEIHRNLEFLVDNRVIKSGIDSRSYQLNLLRLANIPSNIFIANQFKTSSLKERIVMLNKKPSSGSKLIAYTFFLPLAFLFLATNHIVAINDSFNLYEKITNENSSETIPVDQIPENAESIFIENVGEVFIDVDETPSFPEGLAGFNQFLRKNLNYPIEAQEKRISGRVICSFIVNTNGTISNVEIISGIDPLLDNEALRVISRSPRWNPGKHRGKAVPVKMNIPISFRVSE